MDILKVLDEVVSLLQQRGRITYRILQRQFALDDEALADLKAELLFSYPEIAEVEGQGLTWTENKRGTETGNWRRGEAETTPQPPVTYTPVHLAERIRAEQAAMESRGSANGERKTITALFADLKGSTALIEGLDPEEARAIIDPALQLMMDAVHRYEGYVAQALGDGIFALFGAPLAHEDHPQRALYAALRMQDSMRRYGDTLRQKGYPPLLMRVGLNSGEVVLRSICKDDLHTDYVPVGHSTNLAARMEQLATPGSIVVSAYTHRLTDGYFAFKDLGPTQIKGVEEPLNLYEVVGVGPLRTRLQVSASRYGLTRFVGRQSELAQLNTALAHAKTGQGQIVGVMGEPGLGKSRLFYEFKLLFLGGCLVLEAYSVSHGKATAYLPVIELLKSYFDIQATDDERKRREKVLGKVLGLDRSLEDTLLYLFALLGIEKQPSPLQQMDAQIRRQRTFEALKKLFLRESMNQPLVLVFEDLHWIDGETQGFLDVLSESMASAKLLLLTNYRPEYRHEWGQKTYYTQLRLAPLGREEADELLSFLLGNDTSLTPVKALILEKTQGTPFFIEEVVQTLAEEGALVGERGGYRLVQTPTTLHLPSTVQAILAARIDRLAPEEKALLQQLSVIGRQFPMSLVRQVITQPEADLYRLLASLQHKEFLYEQPAFPESEYIFKHALTQEVAYGTVLHEQRKALHERTGQAMEVLYKEKLDERYSELAHHYKQSDNTAKAVEYLHLAGQQASQRSAYEDAIRHLSAARELLLAMPDSPERAHQELDVQLQLGTPLLATTGWGSMELERAARRAQALCQQLGETEQLFPALVRLGMIYSVRADYTAAHAQGEQFLSLAEQLQNPELLMEAHVQLGYTSFFFGDVAEARRHTENAFALYDAERHRSHALQYGTDPGAASQMYKAMSLWFLGYPDQALREVDDARGLAAQIAHPFTLAFALNDTSWFYLFRQGPQPALEWAKRCLTYVTDQGFAVWVPLATATRGWALVMLGQGEEGIVQMCRGMDECVVQSMRSQFLGLLAQAYGKMGQVQEGLAALEEAFAHVDATGERIYEAELYRLKGELTLQSSVQRLVPCLINALAGQAASNSYC